MATNQFSAQHFSYGHFSGGHFSIFDGVDNLATRIGGGLPYWREKTAKQEVSEIVDEIFKTEISKKIVVSDPIDKVPIKYDVIIKAIIEKIIEDAVNSGEIKSDEELKRLENEKLTKMIRDMYLQRILWLREKDEEFALVLLLN
jgi:hypothetical protein